MVHGRMWLQRVLLVLVAAATLASCSLRSGVAAAGLVPPPDGTSFARGFVDGVQRERGALGLPAVPRDPALDEWAGKGLQAIEAGVPDGVGVVDHLLAVTALPRELEYGIGFEDQARGLDERVRELAARKGGAQFSKRHLASDPALDGLGWRARGPWAVFVLRARLLVPADGPALQAGLVAVVQGLRPALEPDPRLEALAAEVLGDDVIDDHDDGRLARAGGVPVRVGTTRKGPHLPVLDLLRVLDDKGPGALDERWLTRAGVASRMSDDGTVRSMVVATGEADRAALDAQLDAAAATAPDLVNRSRAEALLPPVVMDPLLVRVAEGWVAESSRRGCYIGLRPEDRGCPGIDLPGIDWFLVDQATWYSPAAPFRWDLSPAQPGDERLKAFGAAAAVGPDGMVWTILLFVPGA